MSHRTAKQQLSRRTFLQSTGIGGAVLACSSSARVAAASQQVVRGLDRPVGAVIGLGNRGRGIAEWQMPPYADVVAICDIDLRKTGRVAEEIERRTGRRVEIYQDYRQVLDRKDIHVIANATCEHWHSKINIEACRAGKDVYAEKPLTFTIDEGKILCRVVKETGRVIQVGTQQRSGVQFQVACSLVRNGRIGKLRQIAVIVPGGRHFIGEKAIPSPVPNGLNWEVWSGQAPLHPFSEDRLVYRHWSDYGGGLVTDWGAHHMDIAHWGMGGEEVGPLAIEAAGYCPNYGKPDYPDTFRPFAARLEYPSGVEMSFFSTPPKVDARQDSTEKTDFDDIYAMVPESLRNYEVPDQDGGVLFIGEKGRIFVGRSLAIGEGIGELENLPIPEDRRTTWLSCLYAHMHDFVASVRDRSLPISNVFEQHRTLIPCHLTNIAMSVERKLQWNPETEQFVEDDEANRRLKRVQREPYRLER